MLSTTACQKETPIPTPVIHLALSPSEGNTTQTFTFDLTKSESRTGRSNKVFSRWDWDGDGNWDTPFTKILIYDHRYYAPGTWRPRLEMSNLDGGSDTVSVIIPVIRGYSPPKAKLIMTPGTGHIFTRFLLDASTTRDDEDSLSQLVFRWDFEGDGQWDTNFGDSVRIHHVYPETGYYTPRFQVRDPSGLISQGDSKVTVTLTDPRLVASFRCIPDSVTDNTDIIMDASASVDLDNPGEPLFYRWDWNNDRIWDTGWLSEAGTVHVFTEEYIHYVRLQVMSHRGLINETWSKLRVYHKNRPPSASFAVSTFTGNVKTKFRFDCWSTRDTESSPSEMFYRWDFNGDGIWDTEYSGTVVTFHQYDTPGTYRALLEVKDPLGATDTISKLIYISHGTNETGIYDDWRGDPYQSYGTVLIGEQWWFTRNMCLHDTSNVRQYYYNNSWRIYFDYGNLYLKGYLGGICPKGWRAPSREDWDKLFSNYPADKLYEALMPGGESDFGANLGGMGIGWDVETAIYSGLDHYGNYWSTTKPLGAESSSTWIITFEKDARRVSKGYNEETLRMYSVRCVKDAK